MSLNVLISMVLTHKKACIKDPSKYLSDIAFLDPSTIY